MPIIILLVIMIALMALSILMSPKAPAPPSPEAGDQQAPQNDPSKSLGVIFGRARIPDPNVAWFGNTSQLPIMSDSGGKK
jgi:hypothetical protein